VALAITGMTCGHCVAAVKKALAAVPGDDGAGFTTAMTVSSNFVTQGGSVTVTLNVRSTAGAVSSVSPTDLAVTGGNATCSGPSPASANVPNGGAGVNFVWSCVVADQGEYVFSAGADDGGANSWPDANSASVLASAGGGPNVITWSLGSTSAAVPGETIISGYTAGVYGFRGGSTTTFRKYDPNSGAWSAKANAPANVAKGGALTTDGAGTIYGLGGNAGQTFWAYDAATNVWTAKATTGTNVGEGGAATFLDVSGTKYVFALMGNGTKTFKRYSVSGDSWASMADTPAAVKKGGSLTTDGTNMPSGSIEPSWILIRPPRNVVHAPPRRTRRSICSTERAHSIRSSDGSILAA